MMHERRWTEKEKTVKKEDKWMRPQFSCYQLISSNYFLVNDDVARIYVSLESHISCSHLTVFNI